VARRARPADGRESLTAPAVTPRLPGDSGHVGARVPPVRSNPCVQLAKDDIRAVPAEHLRDRHRRQVSRLVGVAQDELARLDRSLIRVGAGDNGPLYCRLADSVLEAKGGALGQQLVAVLAPDHLHAG
jgi:hypothetical protein